MNPRRIAIAVLVLLGVFWTAVAVAGAVNSGYSHTRDYVSALASVGASHAWLGVLAIASVGLAFALVALLVRRFSRTASVSVAVAGLGYVIAALVRIRCEEGAASCAVGDRMSDDLENARGFAHEGAIILSTLLLVVAMTSLGIALLRSGRRAGGIASLVAALATVVTFSLVGGDSPGGMQRVWIAVMTLWAVGVAVWAPARRESARPA